MNKNEKTIEQLEEELEQMKSFHRGEWETYGSELSAGDMLHKETMLEKEIFKRKAEKEEEYIHDVSQVLDDPTRPVTGLEQLRAVREETKNRWEKSGLLEGLMPMEGNAAAVFEGQLSYKINEDDSSYCTDVKPIRLYSREEVITIIKRYAFHLSDNGDPDESAKDWFDRMYPEERIVPTK